MTPTERTDEPPADADLACPLCGYNLRGLVDPRCPECGFAFKWAELLDERRSRHPWLFEHGRGGRTLFATYVRTCLPRRFWQQVTPANPVHVRRLALYWLLACLPLLVMAVPFGTIYSTAQRNTAVRAYYSAALNGQPPAFNDKFYWYVYGPPSGVGGSIRTQAQVDAEFPPPWSAGFVTQVWDSTTGTPTSSFRPGRNVTGPTALATVAVVAVWPWLSAAALLIFQASMRRAKVDPAHVLRAAVYGCDFGLLLLAVVAAFPVLLVWSDETGRWVDWVLPPVAYKPGTPTVAVAVVACAAVACYRLTVAYARYLRFDRPLLTVLASQAIAVLAAATALMTLVVSRR